MRHRLPRPRVLAVPGTRSFRARAAALAALLIGAAGPPAAAAAQIPDRFENLQVLPPDIPRDSLIQLMRGFSFALGVRCEHCHVARERTTAANRFALDSVGAKERARFMMQMTARVNADIRSGLPGLEGEPLRVGCKTCHRGVSKPYLLSDELRRVVASDGVEAAIARYRELRETYGMAGAYDFREWEMNELARTLEAEGRLRAAIAMLVLNEEFHPASASIPLMLGRLHEAEGRRPDAIAAYRRALARDPGNRTAAARLAALGAG